MPPPMIATRVMGLPPGCRSGERATPSVHGGNSACAFRMVAVRGVVEYGVVREVHDERVHDREGGRIEPGHVQLVVTNRNGYIVFRRELRADQRTLYGNALDHRVTIGLPEGVPGVPAQRVARVEHV